MVAAHVLPKGGDITYPKYLLERNLVVYLPGLKADRGVVIGAKEP